jgi:hypothetical protein
VELVKLQRNFGGSHLSISDGRSGDLQGVESAIKMLSVSYTNEGWSPSLGSMEMTTLAVSGDRQDPRRRRHQQGATINRPSFTARVVLRRVALDRFLRTDMGR